MKKKYLLVIVAIILLSGAILATGSIASAENDTDVIVTEQDDTPVTTASSKDMLLDSSVNLISSNKATVDIVLLQGSINPDDCSIVFSVTFDNEEYPCEIISPSGQHYTSLTVNAYNREELTGFGIIAYYRIDNIELGTYTVVSSSDASIFNVSVDMGVTDKAELIIDEYGSLDDSRTGNVMSQSEYDAFVDEIIEDEIAAEYDSNESIVTQGGISLEGQTGDVDASTDVECEGTVEEYEEKLLEELSEYSK